MKFILVIHGVTDWNDPEQGRLQGQSGDMELNVKGQEQAAHMAEQLIPHGITRIVSSDLKRASGTAQIISEKLGVPFSTDPRLRECSFGRLEGLSKPLRSHPEYMQCQPDSFLEYDFRPVGGERAKEVFTRHHALLQVIAVMEGDGSILLVGHTRGLNTLLAHLGQEPTLQRGEYREIRYSKEEKT